MDVSNDSVFFDINSDVSSSVQSLQKLSETLNSLNNILTIGTQKINSFTKSIQSLSSINTMQIQAIINNLNQINNFKASTELNKLANSLESVGNLAPKINVKVINQLGQSTKSLNNNISGLPSTINATTNALNGLPTNLKRAANQVDNLSNKNSKIQTTSNLLSGLSKSLSFGAIAIAIRGITNSIGKFVNLSNDYIENLNLFNVSLGNMADTAKEFVNNFSTVLGVDPSPVMRYISIFNTLAEGFGIADEEAYKMSKNLTQLSYDMSSFLNIPIEEAMQKIKSGFSGEIEPMRAVGVALDEASLQETAYALGIDKKVSAMTRAQKSELLYYQIMTRTTKMQGDMARTLIQPANALRILQQEFTQLGRAIGNIFIPILMAIIPYVQVVVKWLTAAAQAIAHLFGFEIDTSAWGSVTDTTADISSGIDDIGDSANKTTKELKKMLAPFDELNVIDFGNDKDSGSGSDSGIGTGGSLGIPLPDYDATQGALNKSLEEAERRLKSIIPYVAAIGAAFAAWKISDKLMSFLQNFKPQTFSISFQVLGLPLLLADLDKFRKYMEDFLKNGPTFENVTGMISSFTGALGDVLLMLGKLKVAGALKVIQGVGEIVLAVKDIADNGVNIDNALTVIRGLTNIAIGIGLFTKNIKVAGWATVIQGFTGIIQELANNWEAIKQGDWSGVDKVTLIVSGLEILGGLAVALDVFSKLKTAKNLTKSVETVNQISSATSSINTGVGKLSPNLSSLAKNLGMGIVIIGEVAAAAILVTGAIWVLGKELEQVGIAWQPVIDNGTTVATAMGIGIGILVGIGVVTGLLGEYGSTQIIVPIAIGTAMLLEIGVAAGLFIAEIWAIGEGLNKINEAWQPVFENGDSILSAIGLGTLTLVAIGVVAGLLGVATAGTAGLLPLAIGLGTAILVELGIAAAAFIVEIWAIGEGLNQINEAWQPVLINGNTIVTAIELGTTILIAIGAASAALGVASVASVGLLPIAIGLGTAMLVEIKNAAISFIDSLVEVAEQLNNKLQPELRKLNSKLPTLIKDLTNYIKFMKIFAGYTVEFTKANAVAGFSNTINTIIGWFTEDPIEKFAKDVKKTYEQAKELNAELRKANPELQTAINLMNHYFNFLEELDRLTGKNSNISLSGSMFVNMKEVGKKLVTGFVSGIKSEYWSLSNAIKSVLNDALSGSLARSYGSSFGSQLGSSIASALRRTSFPRLRGTVSISGLTASINFRAYELGGFPEQGQMFVARERGPELVGNIGNKAAVVNNDQIVESVSQGVYNAVAEANAKNNNQQMINVYLGNKKIYSGYGSYANSENNMYGTNVIR